MVCGTSQQGNRFNVSKVSSSHIAELMIDLQNSKILPKYFDLDGCFQRALRISRYLYNKGLITGTLSIHNSPATIETPSSKTPWLILEWTYHTAPFIYNKSGKKVVFDFAFSDSPLTEERWSQRFLSSRRWSSLKAVSKSVGVFNPVSLKYKHEYDWQDLPPDRTSLLLKNINENLDLQKSLDLHYKDIIDEIHRNRVLVK